MTALPTRRSCSITAAALGVLLGVLPSAATAQNPRGATPPAPVFERVRTPASIGLHGFSVVLVIGGTQAAANPTDNARDVAQVPEAARKALADMKDFLPYKRYQLLDAAWMLCCGPSRAAVSAQVRGPEGRDYQYTIDTLGTSDTKLNLRFAMRETLDTSPTSGAAWLSDTVRLEHSRQLYDAIRERDEAELLVPTVKKRYDVGTATETELESATLRLRRAQQRVQDLQRVTATVQPAASGQSGGRGQGGARGQSYVPIATGPRTVMDSTFSIALGETVVIGTSRIMGDQALIAVLTAAAKPGASR